MLDVILDVIRKSWALEFFQLLISQATVPQAPITCLCCFSPCFDAVFLYYSFTPESLHLLSEIFENRFGQLIFPFL